MTAAPRRLVRAATLISDQAAAGAGGDHRAGALDVDVVAVDGARATEWDELAQRVGSGAYSRPGWMRAWAESFAPGRLQVVRARSGGALVGVLPVLRRHRALWSATNSETPRFAPVLADPSLLAPVLAALSSRWTRVSLSYLPETWPAPGSSVGTCLRREIRRSPYVSTEGDYAAYARSQLSSATRQRLRRFERRLRDLGRLTFEVHDGGGDLERLLEEGFAVEATGWKRAHGTDVLSRPAVRRFYWSVAEWAARMDALRLCFLRLDGKPIAFSYTLLDGQALSAPKLAMDERLRKFAPGRVHVRLLLEHCFEDPAIKRLDMLGEAEPYKMVWATGVEPQSRLDLFGDGVGAQVSAASVVAGWAGRQWIRQKVPLDIRERVDVSTPTGAVRSLSALARDRLGERVGWARRDSNPHAREGREV